MEKQGTAAKRKASESSGTERKRRQCAIEAEKMIDELPTKPSDLDPVADFGPLICPLPYKIRDNKFGLEPTSKWQLCHLEHFCKWGYLPGIGFTRDELDKVELNYAEKVFASCKAGKDEIAGDTWVLDLAPFGDPNHPGFPVLVQTVDICFEQLRQAMKQYTPLVDKPREKKIDTLAMCLAIMCGFNDRTNFFISSESIAFEIGGLPINSEADVYVARRSGNSDQMVLIWEDKLSKTEGTNLETDASAVLKNSAAQIIGELISVHYRNWTHKHDPCEVYAIRLIDDMVAFFKMKMSSEQIEAVCKTGVIPKDPLQVYFTPRHALEAGKRYGVSLLDPENRLWFVKMMACIRAEILKTDTIPSKSFVSQKAGERANPDDL